MKKIVSSLIVCAMLAVSVCSVNATVVSSVEAKAAPTISTVTTSTGVAIDVADIEITALADSSTLDADDQVALDAAYEEIKDASSLVTLVPALADVLEDGESADDLAVRDLFYLDVPTEVYDVLDAGGTVTLSFAVTADAGETFYVMANCDGEWVPVSSEDVTLSADGSTLTVTFSELCPIAFVSNTVAADDSSSDSVDTGDNTNVAMYGIIAAGCAAVAVALVVTRKKEVE